MLTREGWDGTGVYEEMGQWLAVFEGSGKILLRSEPYRYLEGNGQQEQKPWGGSRLEVNSARVTLNEDGAERKVPVGTGGAWEGTGS